jgi:hypothetical protein
MEDMSVLEAPSQEVVYRGETLKVTPLTVGQIPAFLRTIRPALGSLAGLASSPGQAGEGAGIEVDLVALIADHGEALIEALAVATGKPVDWLGKGMADELAVLIKAVVEVNADFFAKRVAPLLVSLTEALGAKANPPGNGAGQTASSS